MWNNEGFGERASNMEGGYMNSQSFGGSGSKPKATKKSQIMVPMSCVHFHKAMSVGDSVKIGDNESSMLTFVGLVRKIDLQSTLHQYEIDDMSGPCLVAKRWITDDMNEDVTQNRLMENTFARVNGIPRKMQGEVFLLVVHLRPVKDINEITLHLLEIVHCRLRLEKAFDKNITAGSSNAYASAPVRNESYDMMSGTGLSKALLDGLLPSQAKVLQVITACQDANGCSLQSLVTVTKLPLKEIRQALDFLSDEGHVYTTIDDEHFKDTNI